MRFGWKNLKILTILDCFGTSLSIKFDKIQFLIGNEKQGKEFNFSRNVMQTGYTAPIATFRLHECIRFQTFFKSVWSKISFIAFHSFFTSVVDYSLNIVCFCATDMFLSVNNLVTLCSHDHFHYSRKFFYLIDSKNFQLEKRAIRKSRRIGFVQISSLWILLWVFLPTGCSHRIFLSFP